jgi:hypothetical protein
VASPENSTVSAFAWNAGGWLGTQVGCTLWVLILGFVLFRRDALVGWTCVSSFFVLNAWGLYLWRSRERLSAYAALQRFLIAASVVIALVVWVVNSRGLSEPPSPGALVSTYLPYWVIAAAPALMLLFFLRERKVRRSHR